MVALIELCGRELACRLCLGHLFYEPTTRVPESLCSLVHLNIFLTFNTILVTFLYYHSKQKLTEIRNSCKTKVEYRISNPTCRMSQFPQGTFFWRRKKSTFFFNLNTIKWCINFLTFEFYLIMKFSVVLKTLNKCLLIHSSGVNRNMVYIIMYRIID